MGHGDQVSRDNVFVFGYPNAYRMFKMLDDAVAQSDGVWVDVSGCRAGGLQVEGITTATLQMRGYISEDGTPPLNTAHGFQIGSDITGDEGFAPWAAAQRFTHFKVRVTAWTTGTIVALLMVDDLERKRR